MLEYKTDQEEFWAGEFGNEYIKRNYDPQIIAGNLNLFSKIFKDTIKVNSILEFGANIGQNLIAIKQLLPEAQITAIEINKSACEFLKKNGWIEVINESILNFEIKETFDFVFTKGVLIHVNPEELFAVYKKLYEATNKYILVAEYYNPQPVEINYRGHSNKLFKRDFAGELLSKYSDLKLLNYGFSYHLDNNFPQDDLNWFLLKKIGGINK